MAASASPDLSIFIVAYNEAETLEPVVRELEAVLAGLGRTCEAVIIDDGSTDATGAIADGLAKELPFLRVIHHEANQGMGGVYRTAFKTARGELVTFLAGDGQFPAAGIGLLLPAMKDADMALGFLPRERRSAFSRAMSFAERLLYRVLFGALPKFQGMFMFRRRLLSEFKLVSDGRGWTVLMELIVRTARAGRPIASVATEMRPRRSGRSKVMNARTIWANLRETIALRARL